MTTSIYLLAGGLCASGIGLIWLSYRVNALAAIVIGYRVELGGRIADLEELCAPVETRPGDAQWTSARDRVSARVLERRGLER